MGIIPACAGNTESGWTFLSYCGDHPRMRGEHLEDVHEWRVFEGSSPHARGTLLFFVLVAFAGGIIPACAGNTATRLHRTIPTWDHPRMRGEHGSVTVPSRLSTGSSPHARGTRRPRHVPRTRRGIIPACAGNTSVGVTHWIRGRDHPRMRGEHESSDIGVMQ